MNTGKRTIEYKSLNGVTAASHPLAAAAAATQYSVGGNAFDAAVATAFALTVVEPQNSGIFGQSHILYRQALSRKIEAIDAFSVAPAAATDSMYTWIPGSTLGDYRFNTVGDANTIGHLSVGVPGALLGWCELHRKHGVLDLHKVLRPAVEYARDGFIVDEKLARDLIKYQEKLARFSGGRRTWFNKSGNPISAGEALIQTDLAQTLEMIATQQESVLYNGEIGQSLSKEMKNNGGIITMEDLHHAKHALLRIQPPITTSLSEWKFYGAPPSTAGGLLVAMIMILMEGMLTKFKDELIIAFVEILRVAFQERISVLGQPSINHESIQHFLDNKNLNALASTVENAIKRRMEGKPNFPLHEAQARKDNEDTTHHSHMDSTGNVVVCTQSIGDKFGSGVVLPGYGLLLNNAMKLFDPRPTHPNAIGPGRKMLSSMAPVILEGADNCLLGLGSPSGTRIISAVSQTLINRLFRKEDLQTSINRPRIHLSAVQLEAESHLSDEEKKVLNHYGYTVNYLPAWNDWFGSVQAVERTSDGILTGGADPRRNASVISVQSQNLNTADQG